PGTAAVDFSAQTGSSPAVPAASGPVTVESLGRQLRGTLPPLRLHSVSIWDDRSNVVWLSEGALGPDEHHVVGEASEALSTDTTLNLHESAMEDGRIAMFLPVRSPKGGLVGIVMILADTKSVGDDVAERLSVPGIRTLLQKLAVQMRPADAAVATGRNRKPV